MIKYAESVRNMNYLAKYLSLYSMKIEEYDKADWIVCDKKSLSMIFTLQLGTYSIQPCRMNWRIKLRTFVTCPLE